MAERTGKRPAGATRIPATYAEQVAAADDRITTADLSGFTREQLERVALDRSLSVSGSDAALRTRILNDLGA